MPWFVFRLGDAECPTILIHREGYPTHAAAEAVAWDNSRFRRQPYGNERVDERIPPFIVEGANMLAALDAWGIEFDQRGGPRAFRHSG